MRAIPEKNQEGGLQAGTCFDPNANNIRIHTDQLMITKCTCVVYFESWTCQIDC